MKLYAVSDGPPSSAVKMVLKYLNIPYEHIEVDYLKSEHMTESYKKLNPQKEIPVLDDDGFLLSESVAIMQYLCDKYAHDSTLYPKDPQERAIVNQRLCFNLAYFYTAILDVIILPMFFDYQRTAQGMKRVIQGLEAFEEYLKRIGKRYVAGDNLTIADISLVCSLSNMEAIEYNLQDYPLIEKWYANFKSDFPELWSICEAAMKEIAFFEKNPPDLSSMVHPIYPIKKLTK